MAIGAHVHFGKHGLTQVGVVVSRAQMGVVREVFGNLHVPLYICHTMYRSDGRQHSFLAKFILLFIQRFELLCISCEVKIYRHLIGVLKRPALLFLSSILS